MELKLAPKFSVTNPKMRGLIYKKRFFMGRMTFRSGHFGPEDVFYGTMVLQRMVYIRRGRD